MGFRYIRIPRARLSPEERLQVFASSQASLHLPEGDVGRKYLVGDRGLDMETIASFRLGYVPLHADHCFAGRIVMPVFDLCGNLIALSVRPATTNKEIDREYGKYWNESYDKGRHLYGMDIAKFWIARLGFAIVVEGQMDTMAMHSWGMGNAVGILGGGFTPFHAMQLKRWTRNIVLLFDGDKAGIDHARRCEEILAYFEWKMLHARNKFSGIRHVKASLPGGTDPSSFLQNHGGGRMRTLIASAMESGLLKAPKSWTSN